jgi:hypothetical protein
MSSSTSVNVPLVRVDDLGDTMRQRGSGDGNIARGRLWWKHFVTGPVLPLLVAIVLYSAVLTDDLFGDEFAQYRWSVLGSSPYGSLLALDVNTQLAKIGYLLLREPWAIRLHSVVFSLGTIVLIWVVAKRCFDRKTAMIAAWVAAFSPYLCEFGAEARPNAIFIFAGILFLYALLLFLQNESWPRALLVVFSACFGLLARPMFVAILLFGSGYYIVRRRRITLKLAMVSLTTIPFIAWMCYTMSVFSRFAPKESSDAPASLLNFLFRLPMAFTYGYCTLHYPERDAGWNISISKTLSENAVPLLIVGVVFCALLVGFVQLLKKAKPQAILLTGAVVVPIAFLLAIQKTGFSILNEKHCAGVVGAYYVLLAVIIVQISRFTWGKCAILLYAYLVAVSLFHFYFQPEIYSRRSNFTALNSFLLGMLEKDDYLMCYHWSSANQPNPFTVFDKASHLVNLGNDKPDGMSLAEYTASVSSTCLGRIYLIYYSAARGWVDPGNCVLPVLKKQRDCVMKRYGRNLSLYEFSRTRECKSQQF